MSVDVMPDPDTAEELIALAAKGRSTIRAREGLAEEVVKRARRQRRRRLVMVGTAGSLVAIGGLAAALLLGRSDYYSVTQPSGAMSPTIAVSEQAVVNRNLEPERGDVVFALWTPPDDLYGSQYPDFLGFSRVIGLPGDVVSCPQEPTGGCDAVEVNGTPLVESYTEGPTKPFDPVEVPAGQTFLLGDARNAASDSRVYGTITLDGVQGVAVQIVDLEGETRTVPGWRIRGLPGPGDAIDPPQPVGSLWP